MLFRGRFRLGLVGALGVACIAFPSVTEADPARLDDIRVVEAAQTPSGFKVPRFVSLKFGRVNARTGPSRQHPIAYQYRRRGLPLVVVAETEMWRKVRDIDGDEAWVRKPALSGERHALLLRDADLTRNAETDSRVMARLAEGVLVRIGKCDDMRVCRIKTATGVKGYVARNALWGAQALN